MEVILLEKIRNLGNLGDTVSVKAGYGRNYLLPQEKAAPATKANIESFELRRKELEKKAAESLSVAEQRAEQLTQLGTVNIPMLASEEGKLYGSVGTLEISNAVNAAGVEISKNEVVLPEGVIRELGEFDINIQVHTDVEMTIKIAVIAQK